MKSFLKRILGHTPETETLSHQQALQIARAECEKRGWRWDHPVFVKESRKEIVVWTNSDHRGGNVVITINAFDGTIIKAGRILY